MALIFTHAAGKAVLVQRAKADGTGLEAYDFTTRVRKAHPEIMNSSPTDLLIGQYGVNEHGKWKVIFPAKQDLTKTSSSAQLKEEGEQSRRDVEEFAFDQDYTKKMIYDQKIDLESEELLEQIAYDTGSITNSNIENMRIGYYAALQDGLKADNSILGSDNVKIDWTTAKTNHVVSATDAEFVDKIIAALIKASKTGKKGSKVYEYHPTFRGIGFSNFAIVIKPEELPVLSKDSRYTAISAFQSMATANSSIPVLNGMVGKLLDTPIIIDNNFEMTDGAATGAKDARALIVPVGSFSPIVLGVRKQLEHMVSPHPDFPVKWTMLTAFANWKLFAVKRYMYATYLITK